MELISVRLTTSVESELEKSLDQQAFVEYLCAGKLEYTMSENEVDVVLGQEAFCGGELDERHYDLIEKSMKENSRPIYFWQGEDETWAKKFQINIKNKNIESQLESIEDKDWNTKWRESFKEIEVEKGFSIIPSWEKKDQAAHNLFIYPGMGFGTGNHETTFLCLKLYYEIKNNLKENFRCLDFGCGSGILGTAPVKHYGANVDFVDIDVEALDNCVINLELNDHNNFNCEKSIILRERYRLKENYYDLVFANILENVLQDEKELLINSLIKGGYLIVSGLLNNQVEGIVADYDQLTSVKVIEKGDWSAILFEK